MGTGNVTLPPSNISLLNFLRPEIPQSIFFMGFFFFFFLPGEIQIPLQGNSNIRSYQSFISTIK